MDVVQVWPYLIDLAGTSIATFFYSPSRLHRQRNQVSCDANHKSGDLIESRCRLPAALGTYGTICASCGTRVAL